MHVHKLQLERSHNNHYIIIYNEEIVFGYGEKFVQVTHFGPEIVQDY